MDSSAILAKIEEITAQLEGLKAAVTGEEMENEMEEGEIQTGEESAPVIAEKKTAVIMKKKPSNFLSSLGAK